MASKPGWTSLGSLVVSIGICLGAGVLGAWATATSVGDWYTQIARPSWNPPDAVFGPVWTTLFVMMGVAAWLIWRADEQPLRARALTLFGVQLLLNVLWSLLFFGLQSPGWAAVEIFLLWLAIAATIVAFARINRLAALLLLPYILWVSFASVLNVTIWNLNR